MNGVTFPLSQKELIRQARGDMTKTAFAKLLGVDRSCMSRYESEELGAPTSVINHCLRAIAAHSGDGSSGPEEPLARALEHARRAVDLLERASGRTAPSV